MKRKFDNHWTELCYFCRTWETPCFKLSHGCYSRIFQLEWKSGRNITIFIQTNLIFRDSYFELIWIKLNYWNHQTIIKSQNNKRVQPCQATITWSFLNNSSKLLFSMDKFKAVCIMLKISILESLKALFVILLCVIMEIWNPFMGYSLLTGSNTTGYNGKYLKMCWL